MRRLDLNGAWDLRHCDPGEGQRAAEGKPIHEYTQILDGDPSVDADAPWMWMRKSPFTFRWDWATRLLTCGNWRGVELRSHEAIAMRDVCLRTTLHADGAATVQALTEVENLTDRGADTRVTVALSGPGEHRAQARTVVPPGVGTIVAELAIPDPALWWPAPLGEPRLYDCVVTAETDRVVRDRTAFRYGLREVALLQEPLPDDEGHSFTLAVNGHKIFCKGANWIPADALMARVTPAKYRALLRLAAKANINMLRVWGGGIFEDPYFYELCDELGILVWQDFLYGCPYYPFDDPGFVAEGRREAEIAVRLLRNHACLALWCGNNEDQWMHHGYAHGKEDAPRYHGDHMFERVLPEVRARLDPTRPYWPGSPYGGEDPNSEKLGDRHSWDVTLHYLTLDERVPYESYARDCGKFISEFGVLTSAPLESLARFLPPGEVYRGSPSWDFHDNVQERGTIAAALRRYWRPPEELDLSHYVLHAQLIQAEALAFALEHWRRRMFRTGGALFWMYSDCWGAASSWTIVDYYLHTKPSYYYVRRAFAPLLASIRPAADRLALWLVNDMLHDVDGALEYGLVELPTSQRQGQTNPVRLPAGSAVRAAELDLSPIQQAEPGRWVAYGRLAVDGRVVSAARRFLSGFYVNRLDLPVAGLTSHLEGGTLTLRAASYARGVRLAPPRGVEVDDNYFDLLPGEERTIHLRGPAELLGQVGVTALNA